MEQIVDSLQKLSTTSGLTRASLSDAMSKNRDVEKGFDYEDLALSELQRLKIQQIVEVLSHRGLQKMINDGNITLGLIRPHAEENKLNLPDDQAEQAILAEIRPPLQVIFTIPVVFTESVVNEMWESVDKKFLSQESAVFPDKFPNKWVEFVASMTSGPTTFFLLHSPEGNAVEEWTKQKGHWDPKIAASGTIREKFGRDRSNNLVHGSSTRQEVAREIGILSKHVRSIISPKK